MKNRFDMDDFDDDSDDESSEDIGLGAVLDAVDKECNSAKDGLNNIRDELDSYLSGLDDMQKMLFEGVANMIKDECSMVETKMDRMVDTIEEIRDFVNPDQRKMHDLQKELKQLRTDHAVTLQRIEDEEGAGFTQSKAQIRRNQEENRRTQDINLNADTQNMTATNNNHNRHFSLMDMYAAFDADNSENSDDSSDEQEDIVVKKFNVTLESASYHCGVIKDVLREMIADLSTISDTEQTLCLSVSETIGGSIDRVQFALDNMYDQGTAEHESYKESQKDLQKAKDDLKRVKAESKTQLDKLYTRLQHKDSSASSGDDFFESMNALGLRDLESDLKTLEVEKQQLKDDMEKESESRNQAERDAKNKAAQLRKLHKDHEELRETFEQCQEQLSEAKSLIAGFDVDKAYTTVDIDDYNAIKEQLEYARITKVTTISFLDAEIRRLKSEIYSIYEGNSNSPKNRAVSWNGA